MRLITRRTKAGRLFLIGVFLFGLSGCGIFVSHYDAGAYQYFTSLKAYHLKFLDDYQAGPGKSFDPAKVGSTCDTGDLKFREARAYADGKSDKTRVNAVDILNNVFKKNCSLLLEQKRLFGVGYAKEQAADAAKNYDLAIHGEASRVGGKAK